MHRYYLSALCCQLFAVICLFMTACRKNNQVVENKYSPEEQWILDSMRTYYYWADKIPGNPSPQSDESSFFKQLLWSADRFSFMEDQNQVETEYSSFAWYGFSYALLSMTELQGRMLGVITHVVPGGAASSQGLHRGTYFTAVNGIELTNQTAASVNQILKRGDGVTLKIVSIQGNTVVDEQPVSLSFSRFYEKPVYMARIFSNGNKKAGYLFYNYFNGNYDLQLLDSLNKLKAAGISELILDMRYNPGGDVSSAAKLAANLVNVSGNTVFSIYEANQYGGRFVNSFQKTMQENNYLPNDFTTVSSSRLNLGRVIILTSVATASAAELLINSLKPYINVVQIGEKTTGKDMGGFPIYDQRTPAQVSLVLHPLIFKLYNANGNGNYTDGIPPDYNIDELEYLPLQEIGSMEDPLLKKALEISIGYPADITGRKPVMPSIGKGEIIFNSSALRSSHGHVTTSRK